MAAWTCDRIIEFLSKTQRCKLLLSLTPPPTTDCSLVRARLKIDFGSVDIVARITGYGRDEMGRLSDGSESEAVYYNTAYTRLKVSGMIGVGVQNTYET